MVDFNSIIANLDSTKPNSRENPLGLKALDLTDANTQKLVLDGNYIDVSGNIYDTTIWPNDLVIRCINSKLISLQYDTEYKVEKVTASGTRAIYYKKIGHNYTYNAYKAKVLINGLNYTANNFIVVKGANNMMLEIEKNTPTFVREFTDIVNTSGEVERTYIGPQTEFKTLGAAKTFVATEISNSIRVNNQYRKFAIFKEVYVAQAKQPEIEFV